jgi:hypothetical protein
MSKPGSNDKISFFTIIPVGRMVMDILSAIQPMERLSRVWGKAGYHE